MTNLPEDGIVPKAFASEIPVWCAHDKIGNIEEAIPNPENPNEHPEARLQAIKRLSDAGCHVTLRLRPYIIGVSDDWRDLIKAGKEAGADSVTTESPDRTPGEHH